MNKNVLSSNIQIIITHMQQTIEVLTSMCAKDKAFSKEYIGNYAAILDAKIKDDDNYRDFTGELGLCDVNLQIVQNDKERIKSLIGSYRNNVNSLNDGKDYNNALISVLKRKNKVIQNSADLSDDVQAKDVLDRNNERIEALIKENKDTDNEIKAELEKIERCNKDLADADQKEEYYRLAKEGSRDFEINEDERNTDKIKLNTLYRLIDTLNITSSYEEIITKLRELNDYLLTREATSKVFDDKLATIKEMTSKANNILVEFVKCIDVKECEKEKNNIIARSSQTEVMTEEEINLRNQEVADLKRQLQLYKSIIDMYTQMIRDLDICASGSKWRMSKLEYDITDTQNDIVDLKVIRPFRDIDYASKTIRKYNKEISNNTRYIRSNYSSIAINEEAKTLIKKLKKDAENTKEDIQRQIEDKKSNNDIVDKFVLDMAKEEIKIINFVVELYNYVTTVISNDYCAMMDNIAVENDRQFIGVIDIRDYHDLPCLYEKEFIDGVKMSIDSEIDNGSIERINKLYIDSLNTQGIVVTKSGKPLTNNVNNVNGKIKNFDGDINGK